MIVIIVICIIGGLALLAFLFYYRWCHCGQKSETPDSFNEVLSPPPGEVLAETPHLAVSDLPHRVILEISSTNLADMPNGREFHELDNHALSIAPYGLPLAAPEDRESFFGLVLSLV